MKRPKVGDTVRFSNVYGDETHIATVRDLLSAQFTAVWEVQRADGGWTEKQAFVLYSDSWEVVK